MGILSKDKENIINANKSTKAAINIGKPYLTVHKDILQMPPRLNDLSSSYSC